MYVLSVTMFVRRESNYILYIMYSGQDRSVPEARTVHPACRAHGPHGRCMHCMTPVLTVKSQVRTLTTGVSACSDPMS